MHYWDKVVRKILAPGANFRTLCNWSHHGQGTESEFLAIGQPNE